MKPGRLALAGPAIALVGAVACATARNYLDPAGPRFSGTAGDAVDRAPGIRVVSYNIEYAKRVPDAVRVLEQSPLREADIVTLQEMDAAGTERIARALAMNWVYFPASWNPKTGRDVGNAVLSPWPIGAARKLLLPHTSRIFHQARAVTVATVQLVETEVRVYSLHLGSPQGTSGRHRRNQAELILADAAGAPGPVVVAGDFNSSSLGRLFEERGYVWATHHAGATTRGQAFDHIFVRGLRASEPASYGVVREGPRASDHFPVFADLAALDTSP